MSGLAMPSVVLASRFSSQLAPCLARPGQALTLGGVGEGMGEDVGRGDVWKGSWAGGGEREGLLAGWVRGNAAVACGRRAWGVQVGACVGEVHRALGVGSPRPQMSSLALKCQAMPQIARAASNVKQCPK